MMQPPVPANEPARLAALLRQRLLDTAPEPDLDRITTLVAHALGVPIALISLIDKDRQWFKSRVGLDAPETSRDISFCGHAVADGQPLVVPDALQDARFADNPLVTGDPSIRFYAGVPLFSSDGHALGTLCAIDRRPRELSDDDQQLLTGLGRCLQDMLYLRYRLGEVAGATSSLLHLVELAFHDLRNPMAGVDAGLQIFARSIGEPLDRELVDDMMVGMREMHRVVLNTLDLAQSTVRPLVAERRPTNLKPLAADLLQVLSPALALRNQKVSVRVSTDLQPLDIDPTLVKRAMGNMLMNAAKSGPDGTTIALSLAEKGDELVITVEDRGKSLPESDREAVFEVFQTANKRHLGDGLGLAVCRLIAEAHGGRAWVEARHDGEDGNRLCMTLRDSARGAAAESPPPPG